MYNEDIPLMGNRELPCFYLRQEDLPEILQWSVGGSYYSNKLSKMLDEK